MTDPRNTDPRDSDPRPVKGLPQADNISGPLGWIVGIAAVVLIAVAVFAGINHAIHPARDKALVTTGNVPNGGMKSPSTTGFGSEEPLPPLPKRGG